jgi:ribonuclease Z
MDKCVELGVPAGPLLGDLKAGKDVVLDDGTVVKAADVVDASTETPQVVVRFFGSVMPSLKCQVVVPRQKN